MSCGFGQAFHVCRKAFLLWAWLGGFLSHKTILSQFFVLYNTVVLVFSTSSSERDIHEAYGHHANGYITKPDNLDVLFQIAEAIETFWVAIAQLTSFNRDRPAGRKRLSVT